MNGYRVTTEHWRLSQVWSVNGYRVNTVHSDGFCFGAVLETLCTSSGSCSWALLSLPPLTGEVSLPSEKKCT